MGHFIVALETDMECDPERTGCHRDYCVIVFCILVNNLENL